MLHRITEWIRVQAIVICGVDGPRTRHEYESVTPP
jgi:hypothetical protein